MAKINWVPPTDFTQLTTSIMSPQSIPPGRVVTGSAIPSDRRLGRFHMVDVRAQKWLKTWVAGTSGAGAGGPLEIAHA